MAQITITEGLAELKTLTSRIAKKREHSSHYILRDSRAVDPLLSTGGSEAFVAQEWQAIRDLEYRFVKIRNAIAKKNLETFLTLDNYTFCITDWLTWRREVSGLKLSYWKNVFASIQRARKEAQNLVSKTENNPPGLASPSLLVNVNESDLITSIEGLEKTLSDLDGKLSLLNATTLIDID